MKHIECISIVHATADGTPLSVSRSRVRNNLPISDRLVCSDFDAFTSTPVHNKPGVYVTIITQECGDHFIPLTLWQSHYQLLCQAVQLAALQRNATCYKQQEPLGDRFPMSKSGKHVVCVDVPSGYAMDHITLNDSNLVDVLSSNMPKPQAQAIVSSLLSGTGPDSTYDPHYKDSDIPDDIHLHDSNDNDLPF